MNGISSYAMAIDSGSFTCKVGWTSNPIPTSEIGRVSSLGLAPSRLEAPVDMDQLESLWSTALTAYDGCRCEQFPVLLFDSRIGKESRAEVAEFFFEVFGAESLHCPPEGLVLAAALKALKFSAVSYTPQTAVEIPNSLTTIELASPFTGVIVNIGYDTTRLYQCLSGYVPGQSSNVFPIGGCLATSILSAFLHQPNDPPDPMICNRAKPAMIPSTTPSLFNEDRRHHTPQPQLKHFCCSRLCRFVFEKCCVVTVNPFLDLLRCREPVWTRSGWEQRQPLAADKGTTMESTTCSALSPLQHVASTLPYWLCCPLKATSRRHRGDSISQPESPSHLQYRPRCSRARHHIKTGISNRNSVPEQSYDIQTHPRTEDRRLRWTTTADALHEGPAHDLSRPAERISSSSCVYQCCICSSTAFRHTKSQMHLKKYQTADACDDMKNNRSRFPKYLNFLGDPLEMVKRVEFHRVLRQAPDREDTILKCMKQMSFMAPEIFFSPAYVSQTFASLGVNGLKNLEHRKGLAHSVVSIFKETPIDCKRQMYSNVVLLGGVAGLPNFSQRLVVGIKNALEESNYCHAPSSILSLDRVVLRVLVPQTSEQRRFASWIGLRELWGNRDQLAEFSTTKSEFEERGTF